MKIFTVILFILALLGSTAKDLSIYIDYFINKELITETICVNRNEEIVMCFGQCYIDSRFLKSFEKQDANPINFQLQKSITYLVPEFTLTLPLKKPEISVIFSLPMIQREESSPWNKSVFRPPMV